MLRILGEVRPSVVFFENVPAWVRGGWFRRFGEGLCGLGYRIQSPLFLRASDVGAPHRRERVFVLAVLGDTRRQWRLSECQPGSVCGDGGHKVTDGTKRCQAARRQDVSRPAPDPSSLLAHAQDPNGGRELLPGREGQRGRGPAGGDRELAHAEVQHGDCGRQRPGQEQGEACRRDQQLALFPPARNDFAAWERVAELDPSRMPSAQRGVSVVADGLGFSNNTLLRLGGNGVVPLVAAIAFDVLLSEIGGLT